MDKIEFKCPLCGEQINAPTEMAGGTIQCPECETAVCVPALEDDEIPRAEETDSPSLLHAAPEPAADTATESTSAADEFHPVAAPEEEAMEPPPLPISESAALVAPPPVPEPAEHVVGQPPVSPPTSGEASDDAPRKGNTPGHHTQDSLVSPLRIIDLKLVTILAALTVLSVGELLAGMTYGFFGVNWLARGIVVIAIATYVGSIAMVSLRVGKPIEDGDPDPNRRRVFETVKRVAERARLPMPRAYLLEEEVLNAVTFGFTAEHARIVVTTGLLDQLKDDAELDAVVAHETAHILNLDCLAATVLQSVIRFAGWFHALAIFGARLALGVGGALIQGFAGAGLIGLAIAFGVLMVLVVLLLQLGLMAVFAALGLVLAILAVNAFSRQREYLADDYAAQIVGSDSIARVLVHLAEGSPEEKRTLCLRIGEDPADYGVPDENEEEIEDAPKSLKQPSRPGKALPVGQVVASLQGDKPEIGFGRWMQQLWWDHPPLDCRIQRVLAGRSQRSLGDRLVAPLARWIEKMGRVDDGVRLAARPPCFREGGVMAGAALLGIVTGVVGALMPEQPAWFWCLVLGIPLGIALGVFTGQWLARRGPFLGHDVVDAALTGWLAWSMLTSGVPLAFALHGPASHPLVQLVVLVVSAIVQIVHYAALGRGWIKVSTAS